MDALLKHACCQVRLQANTEQCGLSTDYARMNMRRSGSTSCEMYHPGAAAEFLSSKTCYNVHGVRAQTPRMEVWSERRSTSRVNIRRHLAMPYLFGFSFCCKLVCVLHLCCAGGLLRGLPFCAKAGFPWGGPSSTCWCSRRCCTELCSCLARWVPSQLLHW